MSTPQPPSAVADHIAISRSNGIRIDWKDGHHSEYGLTYLRDRCPCASCTGVHGTEPRSPGVQAPFQLYKAVLKMVDVEPVGSYAMQIKWNDGHSTGIYAYDFLRRICPCAECQSR